MMPYIHADSRSPIYKPLLQTKGKLVGQVLQTKSKSVDLSWLHLMTCHKQIWIPVKFMVRHWTISWDNKFYLKPLNIILYAMHNQLKILLKIMFKLDWYFSVQWIAKKIVSEQCVKHVSSSQQQGVKTCLSSLVKWNQTCFIGQGWFGK